MVYGPLSFSLAPYIRSSRTLSKLFTPVANWYAQNAGYRQYGLKYDDLLLEERDDVQRAIHRLTPREQYDRGFRLKRAALQSVLHSPLPKEKWIKAEEDTRYLAPHVTDVAKEDTEREYWDTIVVARK